LEWDQKELKEQTTSRKDCKNPMKASKTPNKMLNLILGWFREKPLWLMLRACPNANKTSRK
jgi:hypothetical protein